MNFDCIIGQDDIKRVLINSIENDRVNHAYIFDGVRGIGKRSVARLFAGMLSCTSFPGGRVCEKCTPCQMYRAGTLPDFREVSVSGLNIGIDEIRSIQSDIIIRPMYSNRKVYLIPDAERMTVQAQNCLLKTLEEPPPYGVIILTTSNYESLIETVRSRSLKLTFKKNSHEEVCEALRKGAAIEDSTIDFIASYADGVIGSALELAHSEEFIELREATVDKICDLFNCDLIEAFEMCDFFLENKDSINRILDVMISMYRDMLIARSTGKENMLINSDKRDIILKNMSRFSILKLINSIDVIELTRRNIKQNANYQLSIEVMLMKLQEA